MIEPSGVSYKYFGAALGKGRQAAKTLSSAVFRGVSHEGRLIDRGARDQEQEDNRDTRVRQVQAVSMTIYGVHDEAKDKAFELELSWICDESKRQHEKVPNDLLEQAKAAAQAALEEMDAD
ncbi:proteasome subunit alpha type-3-like [Miscanthus floridulus]|uniref:proteasome subunit alpha type-3-like n=1 Tax=Miscanthus floridulus TaxID=154761 RepID=UPI003459B277